MTDTIQASPTKTAHEASAVALASTGTFSIRNEDLGRMAKMLSGAVDHSQVIQILSFLKCRLESGRLYMTASNSEIEMNVDVPVMEASADMAFTLPCRKLLDISKNLPGDAQIHVQVEAAWVKLKAGKTVFKLASLPVANFPHMERQPPETRIRIPEKNLLNALKKTQFCMASNDVRFFLNGLLFQCTPNKLTLVATDGHRLACYHCQPDHVAIEQPSINYILPRKTVQELIKYLQDSEELMDIGFSAHYFSFQNERLSIVSNLIDGDYPAYEKLIPKRHEHQATLENEQLKSSLQRLLPLANEKYHGAKFHFAAQNLRISTQNIHHEEAEDEWGIEYDSDDIAIGFNIHYVLDVLQAIDADHLSVGMINSKDPVAFEAIAADDDALYIIMPLDL